MLVIVQNVVQNLLSFEKDLTCSRSESITASRCRCSWIWLPGKKSRRQMKVGYQDAFSQAGNIPYTQNIIPGLQILRKAEFLFVGKVCVNLISMLFLLYIESRYKIYKVILRGFRDFSSPSDDNLLKLKQFGRFPHQEYGDGLISALNEP